MTTSSTATTTYGRHHQRRPPLSSSSTRPRQQTKQQQNQPQQQQHWTTQSLLLLLVALSAFVVVGVDAFNVAPSRQQVRTTIRSQRIATTTTAATTTSRSNRSQLWVSSMANNGSSGSSSSSSSASASSSSQQSTTTATSSITQSSPEKQSPQKEQQSSTELRRHQQIMDYIMTDVVTSQDRRPIILFDGVCNLCNGSVNVAIDHDSQSKFRFASLQSEVGKALIQEFYEKTEKSDIGLFVPSSSSSSTTTTKISKVYFGSDAVVRILKGLDPPAVQFVGTVGTVVPSFVRDTVYSIVSEHRYLLGESESCRMDFDNEYGSRFVSDPPQSQPSQSTPSSSPASI